MYEDELNAKDETRISENDRVLAWTKDVADSTANEASRSTTQVSRSKVQHVEREHPRVVVNQVVATPAVVVTHVRPESMMKDEISTKAVIGTVLGATAGAIVAYGTYIRTPYPSFDTNFESSDMTWESYSRNALQASRNPSDCQY